MRKNLLFTLGTLGLILAACAGTASPEFGARFQGPINISGKASSGTIIFTISGDGKNFTSIGIILSEAECPGVSAREVQRMSYRLFPVADGKFQVTVENIGVMEGRFTSPTEASGTIDLKFPANSGMTACELGKFSWQAEAQEETAWPWDDLALYPDHRNLRECYDWSGEAHRMESEDFPRVEAWCFMTSSTLEAVAAFYTDALDSSGWVNSFPYLVQESGPFRIYRQKGEAERLTITIYKTAGDEVEVEVVRGWKNK